MKSPDASKPEGFHSVLVPIDLSPRSERVVDRAALLPFAPKGRLTLFHVVPKLLSKTARQRAQADAEEALEAAAHRLARKLPKDTVVRHVVKVGTAAQEIARHAATARADLLVMGRGGGRALRDVVLGSTAERVIRQTRLPVLVVRLPVRGHYRRPLLALDFDEAGKEVLATSLRVIPSPRPVLSVVHAWDAPYEGLWYPSLSADEAKEAEEASRQEVAGKLTRFMATVLASLRPTDTDEPLAWNTWVRTGSPRRVVEKTVEKARADLLALGTHGYSGAALLFLGTVAGDVLREVPCDVLVVPPRARDAGEA